MEKAWLLGLAVVVATAAVLLILHHPQVGELFQHHVRDGPKRRLFLAAVGFFITFAVARLLAYAAYRNVAHFHYLRLAASTSIT